MTLYLYTRSLIADKWNPGNELIHLSKAYRSVTKLFADFLRSATMYFALLSFMHFLCNYIKYFFQVTVPTCTSSGIICKSLYLILWIWRTMARTKRTEIKTNLETLGYVYEEKRGSYRSKEVRKIQFIGHI